MTRSTMVKLYLEYCPLAVKLYKDGVDYDKARYATGVAGHDVGHAIGKYPQSDPEEVADIVVRRLIATGRRGVDAEGPLKPDHAFAGRDIFMAWLYQGGDVHPHPEAKYEHGLGFEVDGDTWTPVDYGADTSRFNVRPDCVYPLRLTGEEGYGVGLVTRDYKTNWNAGQHTCDTIQLRSQAVGTYHASSQFMTMRPDFIRREVVNLRTRQTYWEDTWLDGEGIELMKRWGRDIMSVVAAIEEGDRTPRVGKHCQSCQYMHGCSAVTKSNAPLIPSEAARDYILANQTAKNLAVQLKEAVGEGSISFDETTVGYIGKETMTPVDNAAELVWEAWAGKDDYGSSANSAIRGLLKSSRIGITQLKAIAKALYPDKEQKAERARWLATVTKPKVNKRFGIWPRK